MKLSVPRKAMDKQTVVGVDLGGTKVHSAAIRDKEIVKSGRQLISAKGSEEQVVAEVISTIEEVFEPSVVGIGVGVPSVVDIERGIVYDVQNIPSWKEVHLKQILEDRFQVPVTRVGRALPS